jgi:branched-chain amino acid transport system permease protein
VNRIALVLSLLAVAVAPFVLGPYTAYLLSLGLVLATVAVSHSFLLSFGGQLSFAHGGLMGVGAYTGALMARAEFPFPVPLVAAAAVTALVGLLMGLPSIRVAGHYLAMITLAAAVVLHILFLNLVGITGGPAGLTSIPRPSSELASDLLGIAPKNQWIWVTGVILIGSVFLLSRLRESRGGLALMAIRENETAAVSLGIPANRLKLAAFSLSAAVAGLAGGAFAHLISFVSPDSFTLVLSIEILAMVIIGGIGSLAGAVFGAFLVTLLPEALRFGEDYRVIVFLLVLIAVLAFFPAGLAGLVPSAGRGLRALRARRAVPARPDQDGKRLAIDAETMPDTEEDVRAAR